MPGRRLLSEDEALARGLGRTDLTRRRAVLRETLEAVESAGSQEENMFRRTDCHRYVGAEMLEPDGERYRPEMTALLSAESGYVYLDTANRRVCLRGAENSEHPELPWLQDDEIFPFYELRAAADDLRDGRAFDPDGARVRIAAQLATLRESGVRFAVLSTFGCGAFRNPAPQVAHVYRTCIDEVRDSFALIAFAIFHPGYGPDNHQPFAEAFRAG
jgi:hypothetical protein